MIFSTYKRILKRIFSDFQIREKLIYSEGQELMLNKGKIERKT